MRKNLLTFWLLYVPTKIGACVHVSMCVCVCVGRRACVPPKAPPGRKGAVMVIKAKERTPAAGESCRV